MKRMRAILATLLVIGVAGCSVPGPGEAPDGIFDPYEADNRRTHNFNKSVDRVFLAPVSSGYDRALPDAIKNGVGNIGDTVSLPGTVVNQLLQGRLLDASRNTLRFVTNATVGIGGLVDVAADLGMPEDKSDFGETLHVWGFDEGAYVELPFLGPSTERDAVGEVVDLFLNPLDHVLTPEARRAKTGLRVAGVVGDRGRFGDTVDQVLYDSADSYAQLRLIYLQNRRFELGGTDTADQSAYIDPDAIDTEGF